MNFIGGDDESLITGDEFSTGRMLWDIGDDGVGFCRYWH
ncbi:hypothetical protein P303_07420 [Xylella fastidiosa MUL0034]|nr:hypothetical protein P303_07420 [Xylella fastidiosa MUL0034]